MIDFGECWGELRLIATEFDDPNWSQSDRAWASRTLSYMEELEEQFPSNNDINPYEKLWEEMEEFLDSERFSAKKRWTSTWDDHTFGYYEAVMRCRNRFVELTTSAGVGFANKDLPVSKFLEEK